MNVIFGQFDSIVDILFFSIIFGLISELSTQSTNGYPKRRGLLWANYVLIGILFVLFLGLFGYNIRIIHAQVFNDYSNIPIVNGVPAPTIFEVTYDVLSAMLALEILAGSIMILAKRTSIQMNKTVRKFPLIQN